MSEIRGYVWALTVVLFTALSFCLYLVSNLVFDSDVPASRWAAATFVPLLIAFRGLRKKSLSPSGAILGTCVAYICTLCHWSFLTALMLFFTTASAATKVGEASKKSIEGPDNFKAGGCRNWVQVLCNGGVAVHLALLYVADVGLASDLPLDFAKFYRASWLGSAILGALSCCSGDTWASELGVLSSGQPRLITSLRSVPKGTNGAISALGMVASVAGGAVVGFGYFLGIYCGAPAEFVAQSGPQWRLVLLGAIGGCFGSIVDSVLGATVQFSGLDTDKGCISNKPGPGIKHVAGFDFLDNNTVNLISSIVTAFAMPYFAMMMF